MAALAGGGCNPNQGGIEAYVRNNLFVESKNIGSDGRGQGLTLENVKSGQVSGNIFSKRYQGWMSAVLFGTHKPSCSSVTTLGVKDVTFSNNAIHNWGYAFQIEKPSPSDNPTSVIQNVKIESNLFSGSSGSLVSIYDADSNQSGWQSPGTSAVAFLNNDYNAEGSTVIFKSQNDHGAGGFTIPTTSWVEQTPSFSPPSMIGYNHTIGTYHEMVGGSNDTLAFVNSVRNLSRLTNWRPNYSAVKVINYFKDGFGMPMISED